MLGLLLIGGCAAEGPPAWPGDDLPDCATTRSGYVIDALVLPADYDAAKSSTVDLDRDGEPDNRFGEIVVVARAPHYLWDLQPDIDSSLAADELLLGMSIDACARPAFERVELQRGLAIDRSVSPPRLDARSETTLAAVRAPSRDDHTAVQGEARFPLTALLIAADAPWLDGIALTVRLDTVTDAELRGVLAIAFDPAEATAALLPVLAVAISTRIEGCPDACADPDGLTLRDTYDVDMDGVVTAEELAANRVLQVLLQPDVDLLTAVDGVPTYWPGHDQVDDSISLGLRFHATRVELVE